MDGKRAAAAAGALCLAGALFGEMTPSAPVQDFRVPRFGENGYTQWVLQGGEGTYDSAEQVRVKDMALRVYSGDARMVRELSLDSPAATIRLEESRAYSEAPIVIEGSGFTISGTGWTWEGEKRVIQVKEATSVKFSRALADSLSRGDGGEEEESTVIESTGLRLTTTEDAYKFEFTRDVRVRSRQMNLRSDALMALADAPDGGEGAGAPAVGADELESIHRVYAQGKVRIEEAGRTIRAERARFTPKEDRVVLEGLPQIQMPGVYLSGERMESRQGILTVEGGAASGRAQVILLETGGLGIAGGKSLGAETIVLAEQISMRELAKNNEIVFENKVDVMSGPLQVQSDRMTLRSRRNTGASSKAGGDGEASLEVGEVREILAEGAVRIERDGQRATGDRVVFDPLEGKAQLSGSPRVTNGEAVLTGERIELEPETVRVIGSADQRVEVVLPKLPDLGYEKTLAGMEKPSEEASGSASDGTVKKVPTVVSSEHLVMVEGEAGAKRFTFTESVAVEGTNLEATANRLDVFTQDARAPDGTSDAEFDVERILATGEVSIVQTGRTARSDRAILLPEAGKVVLEGDAVAEDERGKVTGHRLTLLRGQRRATVEGGGPENRRATISLPPLPEGEF